MEVGDNIENIIRGIYEKVNSAQNKSVLMPEREIVPALSVRSGGGRGWGLYPGGLFTGGVLPFIRVIVQEAVRGLPPGG